MDFLIIGAVFVILLNNLYRIWIRNFDYWKKRGIPGPVPNLFYGNTKSFVSKSVSHYHEIEEIYKKYRNNGYPVVGYFSGRRPHLLVTDPQTVTDILVKHFTHFHDNETSEMMSLSSDPLLFRNPFFRKGEAWKDIRKQLVPGLSMNRVETYYPIIQSISNRLIEYMDSRSKKSSRSEVDIDDVIGRFTAELASDVIFGIGAHALTERDESMLLDMGQRFLSQFGHVTSYFVWSGLVPLIKKIYKFKIVQEAELNFFQNLVRQVVEMRAKDSSERADFLQLLVHLKKKSVLDVADLTGHAMTFYLDAYDTSALGISHVLLELAKNPNAQKILREEIQATKKIHGEEISCDTMGKMEYLDAVIHESLRLRPPLGLMIKQCTKAFQLKHANLNEPIEIPCGTPITIHIGAIHHDPNHFDNPLEFMPERFFNDNAKKFNERGIYLSFGGGPRLCLGIKYAMTVLKASVCAIIENFELSADVTPKPDSSVYGNIFNYPHKKVTLKVKKIQK